VSEKIINDVINGLNNFNAVVPVVRVKDTIKKVDKNGYLVYMNNGVEEKRQLKRAE
jgi:2-C-methyl-D-erythritol 4-phosphate cytidylyltransferase